MTFTIDQKKQILSEIKQWKENDGENDIKISLCDEGILIKTQHGYDTMYEILINLPLRYPKKKNGFRCKEIKGGAIPLVSIQKIDFQFTNKNLSVSKVLMHISKYLRLEKSKNIHKHESKSVVYDHSAEFNEIWDSPETNDIIKNDTIITKKILDEYNRKIMSDVIQSNIHLKTKTIEIVKESNDGNSNKTDNKETNNTNKDYDVTSEEISNCESDVKSDVKFYLNSDEHSSSDSDGDRINSSNGESDKESDVNSDEKSDVNSDVNADEESDEKSDVNSDEKSDVNSDEKSDVNSDVNSDEKSDVNSDGESIIHLDVDSDRFSINHFDVEFINYPEINSDRESNKHRDVYSDIESINHPEINSDRESINYSDMNSDRDSSIGNNISIDKEFINETNINSGGYNNFGENITEIVFPNNISQKLDQEITKTDNSQNIIDITSLGLSGNITIPENDKEITDIIFSEKNNKVMGITIPYEEINVPKKNYEQIEIIIEPDQEITIHELENNKKLDNINESIQKINSEQTEFIVEPDQKINKNSEQIEITVEPKQKINKNMNILSSDQTIIEMDSNTGSKIVRTTIDFESNPKSDSNIEQNTTDTDSKLDQTTIDQNTTELESNPESDSKLDQTTIDQNTIELEFSPETDSMIEQNTIELESSPETDSTIEQNTTELEFSPETDSMIEQTTIDTIFEQSTVILDIEPKNDQCILNLDPNFEQTVDFSKSDSKFDSIDNLNTDQKTDISEFGSKTEIADQKTDISEFDSKTEIINQKTDISQACQNIDILKSVSKIEQLTVNKEYESGIEPIMNLPETENTLINSMCFPGIDQKVVTSTHELDQLVNILTQEINQDVNTLTHEFNQNVDTLTHKIDQNTDILTQNTDQNVDTLTHELDQSIAILTHELNQLVNISQELDENMNISIQELDQNVDTKISVQENNSYFFDNDMNNMFDLSGEFSLPSDFNPTDIELEDNNSNKLCNSDDDILEYYDDVNDNSDLLDEDYYNYSGSRSNLNISDDIDCLFNDDFEYLSNDDDLDCLSDDDLDCLSDENFDNDTDHESNYESDTENINESLKPFVQHVHDICGFYRKFHVNNVTLPKISESSKLVKHTQYIIHSQCEEILKIKNSLCVSISYEENLDSITLKLHRDFFDKSSDIYKHYTTLFPDQVVILFEFPEKYPKIPPMIKLMSGNLNINFMTNFKQLHIFKESYWNNSITIHMIIKCIKIFMEYYEITDIIYSNDLSTAMRAFGQVNGLDTSNINIGIEYYSDIITINDSNDDPKNKVNDPKNKVNDTGVGYGYVYNNNSNWKPSDQNTTETRSSEKIIESGKYLYLSIIRSLQNGNNILLDLIGSPYHEFMANFLEKNSVSYILDNLTMFNMLMNILRILPDSCIEFFEHKINDKSLIERMELLKYDLETYAKMKKSDGIDTHIITNYINLCNRIINIKENKISYDNIIDFESEYLDIEEIYVNTLKDESFKEDNSFPIVNDALGDKGNRCILKEILSIRNDIPVSFSSSIFYRYNPDNIKQHKFVITGPENTPYDSGYFLFTMDNCSDYPNRPPIVKTCTVGDKTFKFNPNLYTCGRICLSLLGTFSSNSETEKWNPNFSNMMQIMISIQSMIFVPDPYYNETGREPKRAGNDFHHISSKYNRNIEYYTIKWAMIDIIKNPPSGFENAVKSHFMIKKEYIKSICKEWTKKPNTHGCIAAQYEILCELLDSME